MKEIYKMSLFEIRKTAMVRTTYLVSTLAVLAMWFVFSMVSEGSTWKRLAFEAGDNPPMLLLSVFMLCFPMMAIIEFVYGADFKDKTINYDILYGHTRAQAFLGRALAILTVVFFGTFLTLLLPVTITAFIMEPGAGVEWGGLLVRYFLFLLVEIRMVMEIIVVATVVKHVQLTSLVYLGLFAIGAVGMNGNVYLSSINTVGILLDCTSFVSYRIEDLSQVQVLQCMPDVSTILSIIVYSLVFIIGTGAIGLAAFSGDDMK